MANVFYVILVAVYFDCFTLVLSWQYSGGIIVRVGYGVKSVGEGSDEPIRSTRGTMSKATTMMSRDVGTVATTGWDEQCTSAQTMSCDDGYESTMNSRA